MIVVDASVAAKWLFTDEEHSEAARALIRSEIEADELLLAPSHFRGEVVNVIRKRMRRESLSQAGALTLLARFLLLPIDVIDPPREHGDAIVTANTFDLPTVYDAYYLNVARFVGCEFWTDDRRLLRTLGGRLRYVRWIGDYTG